MVWQIELFGRLRATSEEREITGFRTAKMDALFAYLAYHADKAHTRESLVDLLWPDAYLDAGRNNLSTALSYLRSQLEPRGVARGAVLRADRATVQINPDAIHTDVSDFKAALQKAGKAHNQEARAELWMQAMGIYKGKLLPDFYDDWVEQERQHLAAAFERAAGQLIAHFKTAGQPGLAIGYAVRLVAEAPGSEAAHCELMRLYRAQGEYAAALRQFHRLEQHLARLEDQPSAALRALAEEIEQEGKRGKGKEEREETDEIPDTRYKIQEGEDSLSTINYQLSTSSLPSFVVLLHTDIEGSTAEWHKEREGYGRVLAQHHALMRDAFGRHGGVEVNETGDGFIAAFENATAALACSIEAQQALRDFTWPMNLNAPRVRMALHAGHLEWENGDARGVALHYVARLSSAAHGGQVLCSQTLSHLIADAELLETNIRLRELGVYRLRDFEDAEKVSQVYRSDMPCPEFPPLKALSGYTDSLPLSTTRFIGREQELAQLETLLLPPEKRTLPCRLLTLTGLGGTGKTRLALELARRMVEPMEGAVWYVPLVDVMEARGLADALRQHLDLPNAPNADLREQLAELLSRRPCLLVLDNFEQLLSTQDAPAREPDAHNAAALVGELLERVPTLTVMVTSRHLLRLAQEREFAVPPLQTPDVFQSLTPSQNDIYLTKLNGCESVRLFVERAREARGDFQLTLRNAPAIAELCVHLEGLPLAIELAAARAQILTPAQMLAQLNDRFKFLVSRSRNIAPRQRSLRASLDMSYALLSPPLQQFLAQLSIFRGGWTWEAAEAIAKDEGGREEEKKRRREEGKTQRPEEFLSTINYQLSTSSFDVLDYLAELRDSSLVVAEESGEQIRFRLLETLREYADEQLSGAEREGLRQAHYSYYLKLAKRAEPELTGPGQSEWLDCLESEHDNFRAALRGAGNAEARLRLAGALYRFWERRDHFQEGRFWLEAAEDAVSLDAAVRARALNGAGVLALSQGDYAAAQRMLEHSLSVYEAIGDLYGIGQTRNNIGNVLRIQGNYTNAKGYYETSLVTWERYGDTSNMARVLSNLGITARSQGDLADARRHLEASLELCERIGDEMQAATVLINLGRLAATQEQYAQAQDCYLRSLELFRKLGRKASIALALLNLGSVALECQGCATAWPLLTESLLLLQEVADRGNIPFVLEIMADAMIRLSRAECAALLLGASASLREIYKAPLPVSERAQIEQNLAELQRQLGAQAFEAAWNKGASMNREQVIEYACLQTVNERPTVGGN